MNKTDMGRMRWDCNQGGPGCNCFNLKRRPKIEVFGDCFPGRIRFGDVDAVCEINGRFILLEWKTPGGCIKCGQRILFERFSARGDYVLVVVGDAESMAVTEYCEFWMGNQRPWVKASLEDVKERVRRWVDYAGKRVAVATAG